MTAFVGKKYKAIFRKHFRLRIHLLFNRHTSDRLSCITLYICFKKACIIIDVNLRNKLNYTVMKSVLSSLPLQIQKVYYKTAMGGTSIQKIFIIMSII